MMSQPNDDSAIVESSSAAAGKTCSPLFREEHLKNAELVPSSKVQNNYVQNNNYTFNANGSIECTRITSGLDLDSSEFTWINGGDRGYVHRNILYQIVHYKIISSKDSKENLGPMLVLNLRVLGGYSLIKGKQFFVQYPFYQNGCYCEKLMGHCDCRSVDVNVDIIRPDEVQDYCADISSQVAMVAPKKFVEAAITFGDARFTGAFIWITSTLIDRKFRNNSVLPFKLFVDTDLSREFTGSINYSSRFSNYGEVAQSKSMVMKLVKSTLDSSINQIKALWRTFQNNGMTYTVNNGNSCNRLTKLDEQLYLQAWQFVNMNCDNCEIKFLPEHSTSTEDVTEITKILRKRVNRKRRGVSASANLGKLKKKVSSASLLESVIDIRRDADINYESDNEENA